MTSLW